MDAKKKAKLRREIKGLVEGSICRDFGLTAIPDPICAECGVPMRPEP